MILFLINTNSVYATKNCTNLSFFVNEHSALINNSSLISSKDFSKIAGYSCHNNHKIKRNKSLKSLRNHAFFYSLENIILGLDDNDFDDDQKVQKKTKTSKRNRSAYIGNIFGASDIFEFDFIEQLNTYKSIFYLDKHCLDIVILSYSPPPENS